jgi:hypothetical protein
MKTVSMWLLGYWHELAYLILALLFVAQYVWHAWSHGGASSGHKKRIPSEMPMILLLIFVILIAFRIEQLGSEMTEQLRKVLAFNEGNDIERIRRIRERLDPRFDSVFGKHITKSVDNLVTAVQRGKLELSDQYEFRSLYKETLENFPNSEFLATSIPSKSYFWRDPSIDEAIARFIKNGGKMRRIFFVKDREVQKNSEAWEIMARQEAMGVHVYIAYADEVPREYYKLFLVESRRKFVWSVEIGVKNEITTVVGESDPDAVEQYFKIWGQLLRLDCVRPFTARVTPESMPLN